MVGNWATVHGELQPSSAAMPHGCGCCGPEGSMQPVQGWLSTKAVATGWAWLPSACWIGGAAHPWASW